MNSCIPVGFAVALLLQTPVFAVLVTEPADLSPGDTYRLAFITRATRDGASSAIADYNSFVAMAAAGSSELSSIDTEWTAIASTLTVDARDNTSTSPITDGAGVPVYDLAGNRIADGHFDLWDGNLQSPLRIDETGAVRSDQRAWTGTRDEGTAFPSHFLGSGSPVVGDPNSLGSWLTSTLISQSNERPLYALSGVLTAGQVSAVPEPSSFIAFGFVCAATTVALSRRSSRVCGSL